MGALTHYRCSEVLLCQVPHVSRLRTGWDVVKHSFSARLTIVRKNGIIFPSGKTYKYQAEAPPAAVLSKVPKLENNQDFSGYPDINSYYDNQSQPEIKRQRM